MLQSLRVHIPVSRCYHRTSPHLNFFQNLWKSKKPVTSTEEVTVLQDDEPIPTEQAIKPKLMRKAVEVVDPIEKDRDVSRMKAIPKAILDKNYTWLANDMLSSKQKCSLAYKREVFGRFGAASPISPTVCFPTEQEFEEAVQFQRHWEPEPRKLMVEIHSDAKEKELKFKEYEQTVEENMEKMAEWIEGHQEKTRRLWRRIDQRQENQQKLAEDIHDFYGYAVDRRSDRFKAFRAEQAELERVEAKRQKKLAKAAKQQALLGPQ